MPYTSVSGPDKRQFGLGSHAIPVMIALAYLVDSIEAEMTLLRTATTIMTACYVLYIGVAALRSFIEYRQGKTGKSKSDKQ